MERGEKWRISHLGERGKIESFRCGDPDLDDFLLNDSVLYIKSLLAVTYVIELNDVVVGYFSLANDSVSVKDFSIKSDFNRFRKSRFVNAKRIKSYPAVKICRLAVSENMKSKGVGSILLDMIKVASLNDVKSACRFITVDAYHSAIPFYLKNGFLPMQQQEDNSGTSLMFYDLMNAIL